MDFRHCPERVRSFVIEGRKCKYLPLPVWVLLLLFFCSHHLIMILQISLLDRDRVFTNAAAGNYTGRQNWGTLCGKVFVVAEVQTCFGRVMLMSYVEGLHARVRAGSIDFEIRLSRSKILGTGKCQCSWIL
jgi:hypothetical protein